MRNSKMERTTVVLASFPARRSAHSRRSRSRFSVTFKRIEDLVAASMYDAYSIGPSIRPVCTR